MATPMDSAIEYDFLWSMTENSAVQQSMHRICLVWFVSHVLQQCRTTAMSARSACGFMLCADGSVDHKVFFGFIKKIAETTDTLRDTSIDAIVQSLKTPESSERFDEEYLYRCQAVFAIFGWLTMLYEPVVRESRRCLEIRQPVTAITSPRFHKRQRNLNAQVHIENASLSFPQLFSSFGLRVPLRSEPRRNFVAAHASSQRDAIHASSIFFSNLLEVGKIQLRFTETLTEHLDLDEHSRTLTIFRHPAYCALICLADPASTSFLSKFTGIQDTYEDASTGITHRAPDPPFDNLCREILISFGIIFGQESRSRRAARSRLLHLTQQQSRDPILQDLCTSRWEDHLLFTYLDSPPVRATYSAESDFEFLGEKLLRIQDYLDAQSPNDFRTLVLDRRDQTRFWTLVGALGFGFLSILLGFIQVFLALVQIAVALG